MFDTHAHLNFPDYNKDREDIIKNCINNEVFLINVGTNYNTSREVIDIADKYDEKIYASVGLHPLYVEEGFNYDSYKNLTEKKKVVAIGETGLDYKYIKSKEDGFKKATKEQELAFKEHIRLSQETNLPLIIHCRMAHREVISILKNEKLENKNIKGVLHCFSSNIKEAKQYLELGLFIGINGIIFKMNLDKEIKEIPLERILLETDCPFLSPVKEKTRNEPMFLRPIAEKIAKIKGEGVEKIIEITTKNAKEVFEI